MGQVLKLSLFLSTIGVIVGCGGDQSGGEFTIVTPEPIRMKPGGWGNTYLVVIWKQGSDPDREVTISFEAPEGLSVDSTRYRFTRQHNNRDEMVTVDASENVPPGVYTLKVIGTPDVGERVTSEIQVIVQSPDERSLP